MQSGPQLVDRRRASEGWRYKARSPSSSRRGCIRRSAAVSNRRPSGAAPEESVLGNVTARIRAALPAMAPSGRRIGTAILADPTAIIHLTVTDVAELTRTSEPTVVRFCKEIGLKGFADLKIRLAAESIPPERGLHEDVLPDDSPRDVLAKVLRTTAAAIDEVAGSIDQAKFTKAVGLLARARHVLFVGVGTSAPVAQDAAYRFRTAGVAAEAPSDAHVQHVSARLLGPDAIAVAVSHTGQTRETLATVSAARGAGASTIAVTSFSRSPLVDLVDVALVAGSRETEFRVEAMASRVAHISVLDALFVASCLANPDRARQAQQLTAEVLTEHRI
jgi:DNA-binding MurR/RpiR family transcriptional regulator